MTSGSEVVMALAMKGDKRPGVTRISVTTPNRILSLSEERQLLTFLGMKFCLVTLSQDRHNTVASAEA